MNAACPQIWQVRLTFDGICQFKETQHVFLYVLCLINVLHLFYILVSPFVKICMGKITSARKELRWLVLTLTTIPLPVCFLGGLIHRLSSAWTQRDRFNLHVCDWVLWASGRLPHSAVLWSSYEHERLRFPLATGSEQQLVRRDRPDSGRNRGADHRDEKLALFYLGGIYVSFPLLHTSKSSLRLYERTHTVSPWKLWDERC